jgi:hypothetical protein
MAQIPTVIYLNSTTPAAPSGKVNVKPQADTNNPQNVSFYMPLAAGSGITFTISAGTLTISGSGGTVNKYSTTFTSATSVTVTHNLGTTAVVVQVWDTSGNEIIPEGKVVTNSNVVTLTFGTAQSGSVVVIG